jgi:uroporphyrinogen decarboxylase
VAEHVCDLGFDVFVTTDDMAFKTGPLFSPQVFREIAVPYYQELAKKITIPWFMHSDGNILPLLDDWVTFGIAGIHPLENGTMDIEMLKREYGDKLCLLGNVDLNYLGSGAPERVDAEVKRLISILAPGGGYIVTSGNSLASYLIPENVRALPKAVHKYGVYE